MNADIKVSMPEGEDSELAEIKIRSWGCISELRFQNSSLNGVAEFTSSDIMRLLRTIREAELQRIDPDPKMVACLEYVVDRIDYFDDEQSRLSLEVEAEMPIASCGSVILTPNFEDSKPPQNASDQI
ncbi:MAG: hypothetical protein QM813_27715 [Verrucomicrobiota bacterium]